MYFIINISFKDLCSVYIFSLEDYNKIKGKSETLKEDEIFVYSTKKGILGDTLKIQSGTTFKIKKHLNEYLNVSTAFLTTIPSIYIITPNLQSFFNENIDIINNQEDIYSVNYIYKFDTNLNYEKQIEFSKSLLKSAKDDFNMKNNIGVTYLESRAMGKANFYGLYGVLFFVGIILSLLFISATVLIIYYKQIVEGYEDKNRFLIMQKIGMTKKKLKKV